MGCIHVCHAPMVGFRVVHSQLQCRDIVDHRSREVDGPAFRRQQGEPEKAWCTKLGGDKTTNSWVERRWRISCSSSSCISWSIVAANGRQSHPPDPDTNIDLSTALLGMPLATPIIDAMYILKAGKNPCTAFISTLWPCIGTVLLSMSVCRTEMRYQSILYTVLRFRSSFAASTRTTKVSHAVKGQCTEKMRVNRGLVTKNHVMRPAAQRSPHMLPRQRKHWAEKCFQVCPKLA